VRDDLQAGIVQILGEGGREGGREGEREKGKREIKI
jgi:hypothetical protein